MSRRTKLAREFQKLNKIEEVDNGIIIMALTHPSFSQENSGIESNQRLEFLGMRFRTWWWPSISIVIIRIG